MLLCSSIVLRNDRFDSKYSSLSFLILSISRRNCIAVSRSAVMLVSCCPIILLRFSITIFLSSNSLFVVNRLEYKIKI